MTAMRVVKGLSPPVLTPTSAAIFNGLQHGDAVTVDNVRSVQELFRRWRKRARRNVRLVRSTDPETPNLLFFLELNRRPGRPAEQLSAVADEI